MKDNRESDPMKELCRLLLSIDDYNKYYNINEVNEHFGEMHRAFILEHEGLPKKFLFRHFLFYERSQKMFRDIYDCKKLLELLDL